MKTIIKITGLLFVLLFAFSFVSQAQTITAHCSGNLKITDSNWSIGDYYVVYVRVETCRAGEVHPHLLITMPTTPALFSSYQEAVPTGHHFF